MEGKQKSLKVNFIMNVVLTVSSIIFPVVTFPYVSRILEPNGTGKVAFASSIISYFSMFAQLGIPTYGIRACAKVRDNQEELIRVTHEILIINMLMSVLTYLILGVALVLVPRFRQDRGLLMVISITILLNTIGVEWLYKALEEYTYIAIRSVVFKFIALLAMFALVRKKEDYIVYGGITIFAASASNILNFVRMIRMIGLKPVGGYCLKRHMKAILVFFAMSCATTIYTNLDTVMLGFMKSDEEVGYYNAAVKVKSVLVGIVTSLGTVLLPRASYYVERGDKKEFLKISRKAVHFVVLTALPLTFFFILFAREGIVLLSGEAYLPSVFPMQIIMPTLLFIGLTNVMGIQMLIPLERERYVLYSEMAGAAIDLVLNVLLIPHMASAGAAIGTLVAEVVVWVVQYVALRDMAGYIYTGMQYGGICLAILAGCAAGIVVKLVNFSTLTSLFMGAVAFFGIYGLVLLLIKEPLILEICDMMLKRLKRGIKRV